jgi:beta-phosphoglucomutase
MLKAVLFDMDGVIVDTEPLHRKAYFMMFKDMDIAISEAMYTGFTGQATLNICEELVAHFQLQEEPETLVKCKRKHFKHLFDNDTSLQLFYA